MFCRFGTNLTKLSMFRFRNPVILLFAMVSLPAMLSETKQAIVSLPAMLSEIKQAIVSLPAMLSLFDGLALPIGSLRAMLSEASSEAIAIYDGKLSPISLPNFYQVTYHYVYHNNL